MSTVTDRLDAWLTYDLTDWVLPLKPLRNWAADAGDDLLQAWEQCPRAEHLVALTAALGVPFTNVVPALHKLGDTALAMLDEDDHEAHALLAQIKSWNSQGTLREESEVLPGYEALMAQHAQRDAMITAADAALRSARRTALEGISQMFGNSVDALKATMRKVHHEQFEALRKAWNTEFETELRAYLETDSRVEQWRAALTAMHQTLSRVHARYAVASVARCILAADKALQSRAQLTNAPPADEDERLDLEDLADMREQHVYCEAACGCYHATLAAGLARAAAEDSVRSAIRAAMAPMLGVIQMEGPVDAGAIIQLDEMLMSTLEAIWTQTTDDASHAMATMFRTSITRATVQAHMHEPSTFWSPSGPSRADDLGLRRALEQTASA